MYINVQNAGTAEEFSRESKKGYWIILYYANWCPHCQMMKPEWQKFAKKHQTDNGVNIAEVESEFVNNLGEEHKSRIQGYPTVTCAKNGKVVASHEGPRTSDSFDDFTNNVVASDNAPLGKMFTAQGNNINTILRKDMKKKTKKSKKSKKSKKAKGKKTVKKNSKNIKKQLAKGIN
jgi:thiol-disulfide isomerase/thioredoxin